MYDAAISNVIVKFKDFLSVGVFLKLYRYLIL